MNVHTYEQTFNLCRCMTHSIFSVSIPKLAKYLVAADVHKHLAGLGQRTGGGHQATEHLLERPV